MSKAMYIEAYSLLDYNDWVCFFFFFSFFNGNNLYNNREQINCSALMNRYFNPALLFSKLQVDSHQLILRGDFNYALDLECAIPGTLSKSAETMKALSRSTGCCYSRIYYFLLDQTLLPPLRASKYMDIIIISDQSPVTMAMLCLPNNELPQCTWWLYSRLLSDKDFVAFLIYPNWLCAGNETVARYYVTLWETIKAYLRGPLFYHQVCVISHYKPLQNMPFTVP